VLSALRHRAAELGDLDRWERDVLDPLDVVREAEKRYRDGDAPLSSVEGFCRQVMGWRDYVWHCYWYFGERYPRANSLAARRSLPPWFRELDGDHVSAACLSDVLAGVRDRGWVHHIPRLMVLGNLARASTPTAAA
jgi:deoxyribodipyrimidine photolyase-related protein